MATVSRIKKEIKIRIDDIVKNKVVHMDVQSNKERDIRLAELELMLVIIDEIDKDKIK